MSQITESAQFTTLLNVSASQTSKLLLFGALDPFSSAGEDWQNTVIIIKYSETVWANSEDPDQTAPQGANSVYVNVVRHSVILDHYVSGYHLHLLDALLQLEFVFYMKTDVSPLLERFSFIQKVRFWYSKGV